MSSDGLGKGSDALVVVPTHTILPVQYFSAGGPELQVLPYLLGFCAGSHPTARLFLWAVVVRAPHSAVSSFPPGRMGSGPRGLS